VLTRLLARGFQMIQESRRRPLPQTETVLVTAHGISNAERRRLEQAGKRLVDTTCPLVERAHAAGLAVNTWTCDEPDRIRWLADLGVDAVITNTPDVALEALGR
jgi:glycerophosphoryl diester phosphodiesterase